MKLEQCLAHKESLRKYLLKNEYIYAFSQHFYIFYLIYFIGHPYYMSQADRYHCPQGKNEEIKVQRGYDLPKIINLRFLEPKYN